MKDQNFARKAPLQRHVHRLRTSFALLLAGLVTGSATAASIASAAVAGAEVRAVSSLPLDGPRFAGDRVVWAQGEADGRSFSVLEDGRQLGFFAALTVHAGSTTRGRAPFLAAGPAGVAVRAVNSVLTGRGDFTNESTSQSFVAAPGELLRPVSEPCEYQTGSQREVDVSATLVAYRAPCSSYAFTRADGGDGVVVASDPEAGQVVRTAGTYAVWNEGHDVVLYDLARREVVRREPNLFFSGAEEEIDVREDGWVLVSSVNAVSTFGPGSEPVRTIPASGPGSRVAVWAQDGIAVLESDLPKLTQGIVGTLNVRNLDGSLRWTVARRVYMQSGRRTFDVSDDGRRILFAQRTCTGARLHIATAGDPVVDAQPPPRACPARLARRPVLRGRYLTFTLAKPICGGFVCRPSVGLRVCRARRCSGSVVTGATAALSGRVKIRLPTAVSKRLRRPQSGVQLRVARSAVEPLPGTDVFSYSLDRGVFQLRDR